MVGNRGRPSSTCLGLATSELQAGITSTTEPGCQLSHPGTLVVAHDNHLLRRCCASCAGQRPALVASFARLEVACLEVALALLALPAERSCSPHSREAALRMYGSGAGRSSAYTTQQHCDTPLNLRLRIGVF